MKKYLFKLLRILTLNYYKRRTEKNSLLILMFHQINDKRSIFYSAISVSAFKNLCQFVKNNYEVISILEVKSHFNKTNKPAAIISFDDAHYDIVENALPILTELGIPFNVNVDTEILETGKPQDFVRVYDILNNTNIETYFNPKYMSKPITINRLNPMIAENEFTEILSNLTTKEKREITEDLATQAGMLEKNFSRMLSKQDIQILSQKNVVFGSHSHSHSILTKIGAEQVRYELEHSKQILESVTKTRINVLAYPNGIYNKKIEQLAIDIGYTILLQTDDQINRISQINGLVNSYKRVNQYHQTLDEALAHTYGILNTIKNLKTKS